MLISLSFAYILLLLEKPFYFTRYKTIFSFFYLVSNILISYILFSLLTSLIPILFIFFIKISSIFLVGDILI